MLRRRYFLAFCLVWLPLIAQAISADDVEVDYRDGVYLGRLSLTIAAAPAAALAVLTDFDHMAAFMPGLAASRIVARQGQVYQVMQQGKMSFGPFALPYESLRRIEVIDGQRILSRALSGSARHMQSEMRLQANGSGTRLDYRIELQPGQWLPSTLGSNFLQHELAEQFTALEQEILRRR